ncbi:flagellar basal body P-ring formation chaperone FlgA [Pseudomonas resinovorans]|uniref:Flagella basal body P-ring formation protein FlgA n=1 Tax=Metapseudomonas resinovorans TaxID=53412 RepID=A0ABT4YBD1_METRE|nr:flagellar basal body P-ring formation chaperone FlgA [Pseudomonas resinovorans]MDA8486180.1 flagellar basal body P-ring formation chaperone FlgA [Pseudomonas resinovorans]
MNTMTTLFRHLMAKRRKSLAAVLPALCCLGYSPASSANLTSPEVLIGTAEGFLEFAVEEYLQRSNIQGRSEIQVNRLDPRLRLTECDKDLTTRLESPAQPLGRVTVRIRCDGSAPWTVFVPAQVRLYREVVVVTRPLRRGAPIAAQDVAVAERDVGTLNQGFLTDPAQIIGQKTTRALLPDQVLAPLHLQQAEVVSKGDQVVISAASASINVRMPGEALSNGAPGEQIRVRNLSSGRVIKARVKAPGQVQVDM